jgi:hypothetical protein
MATAVMRRRGKFPLGITGKEGEAIATHVAPFASITWSRFNGSPGTSGLSASAALAAGRLPGMQKN